MILPPLNLFAALQFLVMARGASDRRHTRQTQIRYEQTQYGYRKGLA